MTELPKEEIIIEIKKPNKEIIEIKEKERRPPKVPDSGNRPKMRGRKKLGGGAGRGFGRLPKSMRMDKPSALKADEKLLKEHPMLRTHVSKFKQTDRRWPSGLNYLKAKRNVLLQQEWWCYYREAEIERLPLRNVSGGGSPRKLCSKKRTKCALKKAEISCGHAPRDYTLLLPPTEEQRKENPYCLLEVISGSTDDKADTIEIKVTKKPNLCDRHHKAGLIIEDDYDWSSGRHRRAKEIPPGTEATVTIPVRSKPVSTTQLWDGTFPVSNILPRGYKIKHSACDRPSDMTAEVLVYPDVRLDFKFEIDFSELVVDVVGLVKDSATGDKLGIVQGTIDGQFEDAFADASIHYRCLKTVDGEEHRLESTIIKVVNYILSWVQLIVWIVCRVIDIVKLAVEGAKAIAIGDWGVGLGVTWPHVKFAYKGHLEEIKQHYRVGTVWQCALEFDPLLAAKAEWDIVSTIIQLPLTIFGLGWVGWIINKVVRSPSLFSRKVGLGYRHNLLSVMLQLSGGASPSIKWSKPRADRPDCRVDQGQLEWTVLEVTIEPVVRVKAAAILIGFCGGMKIGATSAIVAVLGGGVKKFEDGPHEDEVLPYIRGGASWNGLYVYGGFWIGGGSVFGVFHSRKARTEKWLDRKFKKMEEKLLKDSKSDRKWLTKPRGESIGKRDRGHKAKGWFKGALSFAMGKKFMLLKPIGFRPKDHPIINNP